MCEVPPEEQLHPPDVNAAAAGAGCGRVTPVGAPGRYPIAPVNKRCAGLAGTKSGNKNDKATWLIARTGAPPSPAAELPFPWTEPASTGHVRRDVGRRGRAHR